MSFFKSDIVKQELKEIAQLQEKISSNIFSTLDMDKEEKIRHINTLEDLLNKQKILYTRLCLSDDPDAIEMKEKINESAKFIGTSNDVPNVSVIFNNMTELISRLKKQLQDE